MNLFDHLFVVLIFVAFPIYSALTFPAAVRHIQAVGESARVAAYRQVIAIWLIFTAVLLTFWIVTDREFLLLGFQWPSLGKALIGAAIGLIVTALLVLPLRSAANGGDSRSVIPEHMESVLVFLPQTTREQRWFQGVSFNAGVTEEIVFRGYLLWYLQQFVSVYWAAAIAVAAFGLAHLYQGVRNLPGLLFVSAVTVGLYVYTASLLIPVIFHILLDVTQGHYIARIKQRLANPTEPAAASPT